VALGTETGGQRAGLDDQERGMAGGWDGSVGLDERSRRDQGGIKVPYSSREGTVVGTGRM
jgi:hypothetical protein